MLVTVLEDRKYQEVCRMQITQSNTPWADYILMSSLKDANKTTQTGGSLQQF